MRRTKLFFLVFLLALTWLSCDKDLDKVDCTNVPASYNDHIKPLVTTNCALPGCHAAGSSNGDYTTYAGLKAVADNGKLEDRVIHDRDMPPGQPLSLDDRKKIKCWLNNGAPNN